MNQDQLLTKQDLYNFKIEMMDFIAQSLNKQLGEKWIKGDEAREILKCGATKLSELVKIDLIETKGDCKGKLYSKKSIEKYINKLI